MFAQRLDRSKPLWELWLVDRVGGGRFAIISKTHHCLVDGVSGVDIATVLFDLEPDPPRRRRSRRRPGSRARSRPAATLLADALAERAAVRSSRARRGRRARAPGGAPRGSARPSPGSASIIAAGLQGAPASPLNVPIGPHRRFAWVEGDLEAVQGDQDRARRHGQRRRARRVVYRRAARAPVRRGHDVDELELKAMVPVSVRAETERGALGNRVTAMYAPLPVHAADPVERFAIVHAAMGGLKESGQAVGAEVLTKLTGFAAADA